MTEFPTIITLAHTIRWSVFSRYRWIVNWYDERYDEREIAHETPEYKDRDTDEEYTDSNANLIKERHVHVYFLHALSENEFVV